MRRRNATLIAVLFCTVAACGGGGTEAATGTEDSLPTQSSSSPATEGEATTSTAPPEDVAAAVASLAASVEATPDEERCFELRLPAEPQVVERAAAEDPSPEVTEFVEDCERSAILAQEFLDGTTSSESGTEPFTNAWRSAIPYGEGTRTATQQEVEVHARHIYREFPEILRALGL